MNQLLIEVAIKAALDAGARIMEIYESDDIDVDLKSDNSPLTQADLTSHRIIKSYLTKTGIQVLSEEGRNISFDERKNWEQLWIVDPIDGTKEFINKNGEFTVNIALIEKQRPALGVVYVPVLKELYFSTVDKGSYKVTSDIESFTSLEDLIANASSLPIKQPDRDFTVVASRSHLSVETKAFIQSLEEKHGHVECISKGSSLKLCMVAEGKADCYPRFAPTMEWDTAAGQAICNHAGISVIDWETKEEMTYNRKELLNNWFLVAHIGLFQGLKIN